jgi:hypothetical protein
MKGPISGIKQVVIGSPIHDFELLDLDWQPSVAGQVAVELHTIDRGDRVVNNPSVVFCKQERTILDLLCPEREVLAPDFMHIILIGTAVDGGPPQ